MKRREFIAFVSGAAAVWPLTARAQNQPPPSPPAAAPQPQPQPQQVPAAPLPDNTIGQVGTLQGNASVTRGADLKPLKIADHIFKNDTLQTSADSSLGVTFDDETTFSLSANTRIVVDDFVYKAGGNANAASFNVAFGTASFVASLVAQTGNMKVTTPNATLGIRGTTGIVEVPQAGAPGSPAATPVIKLYPDASGHVGQIEVFDRQTGTRLGALIQGASAFSLRAGPGGSLTAVPYQIPPQELARDRGSLQRLLASHGIGRQMTIQRRELRTNPQRQNNQPRPDNQSRPNNRLRQNNQLRPNNQPQPNNLAPGGAQPRPPQRGPASPRPPQPNSGKRNKH